MKLIAPGAVHFIIGATGNGKTHHAIQLCHRHQLHSIEVYAFADSTPENNPYLELPQSVTFTEHIEALEDPYRLEVKLEHVTQIADTRSTQKIWVLDETIRLYPDAVFWCEWISRRTRLGDRVLLTRTTPQHVYDLGLVHELTSHPTLHTLLYLRKEQMNAEDQVSLVRGIHAMDFRPLHQLNVFAQHPQ